MRGLVKKKFSDLFKSRHAALCPKRAGRKKHRFFVKVDAAQPPVEKNETSCKNSVMKKPSCFEKVYGAHRPVEKNELS